MALSGGQRVHSAHFLHCFSSLHKANVIPLCNRRLSVNTADRQCLWGQLARRNNTAFFSLREGDGFPP